MLGNVKTGELDLKGLVMNVTVAFLLIRNRTFQYSDYKDPDAIYRITYPIADELTKDITKLWIIRNRRHGKILGNVKADKLTITLRVLLDLKGRSYEYG